MTICLSMIVKNEAHCISRCLESVKPFIDYWVICDDICTSDNSEEVIKNSLKNIPGEYHRHQWYDFATNRNMALDLSEKHADYILVIDADDYLCVSDPNIFKNLSELAYKIKFLHSTITYKRIQLFKSSLSARYKGILHECIELPSNINPIDLDGCHIIYGGNGASSHDPAKYVRDAQKFEKALISEPDNSRYVFYAAQTYRDAKMLPESLKLYLRRSTMGGWIEEQFMSLFEAGKISEIIEPNNIFQIENLYLSAYNRHPIRSESLVYLAAMCRKFKHFDKAYFYAKIASQIPKPIDSLFLEPSCYDWRAIDELAVSAYWIGKKQEAATLNNILLKSGMLPDCEKIRIINNLAFSET